MIHRLVQKSQWGKKINEWSQHVTLPGSGGLTLYAIINFIYEETKRDSLTTRANSIAFSLFLAIFPFTIFLFTLLPYLPITTDFTQLISSSTKNILPQSTHEYIMGIIHDITLIRRDGLLSLGFIAALYFASNGVMNLMKGFDKANNDHFTKRTGIKKRMIALMLTIMLSMIMAAAILFFTIGKFTLTKIHNAVEHQHDENFDFWINEVLMYCCALSILLIGINMVYRYGPSFKKKLPFFNPGSILASILVLMTSLVFAMFINNFGNFNKIYGSIGALIVLLLLLKLNAFILLVCFELNAAIAINGNSLKQNK